MVERRLPIYRERLAQREARPSEVDLAAVYRAVFRSPEGQMVLDDIVQRICQTDDVAVLTVPVDPMVIVHHNALRYVGLSIYRLARDPGMSEVPEVLRQGDQTT